MTTASFREFGAIYIARASGVWDEFERGSTLDLYKMTRHRESGGSFETLMYRDVKCEECRFNSRLFPGLERYDCLRNGDTNGLVCNANGFCMQHGQTRCPCPVDPGCQHCEVCLEVEVVRVKDCILKRGPIALRDIRVSKDYEWTDFDLCAICKFPVCYAFAPYPHPCLVYANFFESSIARLHTRVLSPPDQAVEGLVAIAQGFLL